MPVTLTRGIVRFAPLLSKRVWKHAQVLLVGALRAPGKRTVTAVLRVMGLEQEPHFQTYHRVLNRARWSSLAVARVLLGLVVETFVAKGPGVMGIDDTWERRRGAKINATGSYRDPVRSSRSPMVKASGLRWLCAMVLAEIPWAGRVWALPFLTGLCPSERYHQQRGKQHKPWSEWAGQPVGLLQRWLPGREVVVVAESSYAVIELLNQVRERNGVSLSTQSLQDDQCSYAANRTGDASAARCCRTSFRASWRAVRCSWRAPQSQAKSCLIANALQDLPGLICLARSRSNSKYAITATATERSTRATSLVT
jgi:hypothetical protein